MPDSNMYDLQWFLSGGAANADPLLSIGGAISSTRILSKLVVRNESLISGVTISDAVGGSIGIWSMTYTSASKTIVLTPQGGAPGDSVDISVDDDYFIQGANDGGGLYITVNASALPSSNTTDTLTVTNKIELILDDVTKVESNAGKTFYRCIALQNLGAVLDEDDKLEVGIAINSNTPGQDNIKIGLATQAASTGAGVDGTDYPNTIADEFTAPAGVTFSAPTIKADALSVGTLSSQAGTSYVKFLWIEREVPVGVREKEDNNTFSLTLFALV